MAAAEFARVARSCLLVLTICICRASASLRAQPLFFVFHGGSGSEKKDIENALASGVVKMNVDTDTQWAYWEGILKFYHKNTDKLQGQIGNNDGPDKPNKSFYDPRVYLREAEKSMAQRVDESCTDLKNKN